MNRKAKLPFDPKVFLSKVNGGQRISNYRKHQIVFQEGDPADAVFYIQKGKIKLTVVSERGKEAVVGILEPTHFFGEGCLNGHPLRVTTATAIEQSLITRIPKAEMIATKTIGDVDIVTFDITEIAHPGDERCVAGLDCLLLPSF